MFLRQKLMLVMVAPLMLAVKSARHHTHSYITMQCASRAEYIIACSMLMRKTIRRSVIVALALTGAAAFVAPQHPATGKALRAAAIEEEPEAPKYPTVNVIAAASDNSAI